MVLDDIGGTNCGYNLDLCLDRADLHVQHDLFLHIVHYCVAVVTSVHRSSTCINEMGHFYIFLSSMNCKFYTSSVHKYIKLDNR